MNLQGEVDGTLILFYTSVSKLPTSWTLPYMPHTESQSLAYSTDGGDSWQEYENNPVIRTTTERPPMHWNITGFRDPFFEPVPALDDVLEVDEPHYYAVFGSGIKGVGPRIPLWTAPASDLTEWTFLGALWEPEANSSLGPVLSTRTYGFNFEVSGFFELKDNAGNEHWFVNMVGLLSSPNLLLRHKDGYRSAPSALLTIHHRAPKVATSRTPSLSILHCGTRVSSRGEFMFGEHTRKVLTQLVSRRENGSAQFTPVAGGLGDWGLSYALTSFNDTKNNRRVQLGKISSVR